MLAMQLLPTRVGQCDYMHTGLSGYDCVIQCGTDRCGINAHLEFI